MMPRGARAPDFGAISERSIAMNENPYASPAVAELVDFNKPRQVIPVSQGKRFIHLIVDSIVIQIFAQLGGFVIGVLFAAARLSSNGEFTDADRQFAGIIGSIWGLLTMILYYVIMEALFQRTVAKFLTGSIVVAEDGHRPTIGQVVGRSFARLIPFEAFSFLTTQPAGWHDSLSHTRVVSVK
jgi:uncharacterized RDD family membrane protein YckC